MKLVVPSLRTTVFRMDALVRAFEGESQMKRVMTIVFASMIALTLSMPAWSQTPAPKPAASQTAKDKEAAKKKKAADKEAAKKKKEADKAAKKKKASK
jgi:hypothetical protein